MDTYIQKGSMLKRIVAWMFDSMLVLMLAVLLASWVSSMFSYETQAAELEAHYVRIEEAFGVDFDITQEAFEALTEQEQEQYNLAYEALSTDEEAMGLYNLLISLTIVIISISVLIAVLLLEFLVPLLLKNGQTLGKKVFGLALVRIDCVRVSPVSLLIRTLLGKFSIETMVPLLLLMMMFWGVVGMIAPAIILGLVILQIAVMVKSEHNTAIHDKLAYTVVVDYASQMIFKTPEEAAAYLEKLENTASVFKD